MAIRPIALLVASGMLAFGCGSRTGLDVLGGGGLGSSGSSGGVGTSSCDGSGDGTPVVLATDNQVMSLAADATSIYWLDESGRVMKVSKCGGPSTQIASADYASGGSGGGFGLAVDTTTAYWADDSGYVHAVPLVGGAPTTVAISSNVLGVAVNGGDLYWVTQGFGGPTSIIGSVAIQGGTAVTIATPSRIAEGPPAVDDTSIYWVGNGLFSMPRGGGVVTTLAASQTACSGLAIDDNNIYWSASLPDRGLVLSTPKTGGPSVTLATVDAYGPSRFAVDAHDLYWTMSGGAVMKVPIGGGSPVTIAAPYAQEVMSVGGIAVDETSVYWAQYGSTPSVMKLSPK